MRHLVKTFCWYLLFMLVATECIRAQELSFDGLFPPDRVLQVEITVSDEDWKLLRKQKRDLRQEFAASRQFAPPPRPYTYVKAKMVIDGVVFPEVGIRKKGFVGSQSNHHPSLKVKLNFTDKNANIDGCSILTLNNNQQDTTLLSQFMGYTFFNQAGSPAPRCSFAKVTVNGKNLGVYSHVETARKPLVERGFGNSHGTLYEGTVVDFFDDWQDSFEKKFGDDKMGKKKLRALIAVLDPESEDLTSNLESELAEIIDLDAFYQFWAIEGLLGFWDGYSGNRNNFFVYWNPETDRLHFLPWGGDCMFQKNSFIDRDPNLPLCVKTNGLLAYRLYQTPTGRERYRTTLLKMMD